MLCCDVLFFGGMFERHYLFFQNVLMPKKKKIWEKIGKKIAALKRDQRLESWD